MKKKLHGSNASTVPSWCRCLSYGDYFASGEGESTWETELFSYSLVQISSSFFFGSCSAYYLFTSILRAIAKAPPPSK